MAVMRTVAFGGFRHQASTVHGPEHHDGIVADRPWPPYPLVASNAPAAFLAAGAVT